MRDFLTERPDLKGKTILITGGTGSFGKAMVRHLLENFDLRRIIIFSRDEMKQWEMSYDSAFRDKRTLRYFIGDVRDGDRLEMAMRGVDYVIHAAALKHVPAAEYNPFECIRTNVHGAENVVQAAIRTGVKRVIALSTDKAANPINLYGASKLASDKIFVAGNHLSGSAETRFSVVRYGNVIGSRGSVIPLFRKMIADGADHLPITDERMTRFWITLVQGVRFVLSSLKLMRGGEIFVPKLPSMKVTDVARFIAPQTPQKIIGMRPGEKLHEVMITREDALNTMELADRYVIEPAFVFWSANRQPPTLARKVADDFSYTSDNNPEWLDTATLGRMIETV